MEFFYDVVDYCFVVVFWGVDEFVVDCEYVFDDCDVVGYVYC